jgi:hypothetical protein
MARSAGILILIALGAAVTGVLFGFLLYIISKRIQKKRQVMSQKKINLITTGTAKQSGTTMVKVGINKPSTRKKDAIETLFKNPPNTVILENRRKSHMLDGPLGSEIVSQKNTSMVEKQKQYSEPNVLNLSEIIQQKNITMLEEPKESLKSNDPQLVHYTNIAASEIQIKSNQQTVVKEPEIARLKKKSTGRETKKSSKPNATKELKTIKQENTSVLRELKLSSIPDVLKEVEIINQQITRSDVRQNESSKSGIVKELETNLVIANTPWSGKVLPFQTSSWDSKHAEDEPLLTRHFQELIQLYVDVGLANNIAWMATEFGHRSKELDESYIRLCDIIAERIKGIVPLLNGII